MSLLVYHAEILYHGATQLSARERIRRFVHRQISANHATVLEEGPELPESESYPVTIALDEYRPGSLHEDCQGYIYVGPADRRSYSILASHPNSPLRRGTP